MDMDCERITCGETLAVDRSGTCAAAVMDGLKEEWETERGSVAAAPAHGLAAVAELLGLKLGCGREGEPGTMELKFG